MNDSNCHHSTLSGTALCRAPLERCGPDPLQRDARGTSKSTPSESRTQRIDGELQNRVRMAGEQPIPIRPKTYQPFRQIPAVDLLPLIKICCCHHCPITHRPQVSTHRMILCLSQHPSMPLLQINKPPPDHAVTGRIKTGHWWALQNRPVFRCVMYLIVVIPFNFTPSF